ncbi:probable protein phosphatase 2C 43 [Trifolium pratense]|nr:probable protein phosphatase 2C 43 [Trifolium pratense]
MASFLNNLFSSPYKKYNFKDEQFNKDPLAWSRPLVRHHCGEFSMAAIQANTDMEDESQVEVGTDALFVGVYDGHKGMIQQNNNSMNEIILRQVVDQMETDFNEFARNSFEQHHEVQNSFVSSGCLICIIWKGTLFVANVGDSRAILGSQKGIGKRLVVKQMVRDHSFLNPNIKQEFTELHPDYNNRSRYQSIEVKGLIETSRCIGYAYMKNAQFTKRRSFEIPLSEVVTPTFTRPLLSSQPDVYSTVLRDSDRFIIFGSGGFWKLISNEKAARVVNTSPRDRIAERLVTLALEKGAAKRGKKYRDLIEIPKSNCISGNNGNRNYGFRSAYHDDITVIVVYLDQRLNREGVTPEINSYTGYDYAVQQSEFTNFYNNANA